MNPRCPGAVALAVVLLPVLVLPSGCGPIEYLNQVSGRATAALAQAKSVGADQHAPYEFTLAGEYLRAAREKAGHSAYQLAIEYGKRAEEAAQKAEAIARERAAAVAPSAEGAAAPSRAGGP